METVTVVLQNGIKVQGKVARLLPCHSGTKVLLSSGFIGRLVKEK